MSQAQASVFNKFFHVFLQKGLFELEDALRSEQLMRELGLTWIESLIRKKILTPMQIAQSCAEHWNLPFYDLDDLDLVAIPEHRLEERFVKEHQVLPLFYQENKLYLAIADPDQLSLFNEIQFRCGTDICLVICEHDKLMRIISNLSITHKAIENSEEKTVQQVTQILTEAIRVNASDVHFEPHPNYFRIRIRIDGILHALTELPLEIAPQILARLKILGKLDIAERRLPQDGRFSFDINSQIKDCRISTCPVLHGEKIVVRLLDGNKNTLNIDELGLEETQKALFMTHIKKPQGMILVTGPTGSGKTFTIYTALNILNSLEKNISTIEDPVEIQLHGINQMNVNSKIGLTFATALRTFLRQDPDIIMVGEIRDTETAEIAIKAAQTGHLVFSTLHTNSAVETLIRLTNMGITPYNIAHSVSLIVAQRLIRKLCECQTGCKRCVKGYRGRLGVFECLPVTEDVAKALLAGKTVQEMTNIAKQAGMITLQEAAYRKVKLGITNVTEVQRVLN